jgi:hypothetical protein
MVRLPRAVPVLLNGTAVLLLFLAVPVEVTVPSGVVAAFRSGSIMLKSFIGYLNRLVAEVSAALV